MNSLINNLNYITEHEDEFNLIIADLINNEQVRKMQLFRQHYDTNCFEHCLNVAFYSYKICKKLNLDYISATRAGMLHDLFLYDWRKKSNDNKGLHGFRHPKIAFKNADNLFFINKKEKDIIIKHMWPLTVLFPRYKESYIVSFVDKYCTLKESFMYYYKLPRLQRMYRFGYVFLSMLIFRII